jgi:hypothetical protein
MLMVRHQDLFVEMSTHLQTALQEIQKLHDQLRDSDATVRAYQRMVAGEASDLYTSNTCTWLASSSGPGAKDEPAEDSHSPRLPYSLGVLPIVCNKFASLERFILINIWMCDVCACSV